MLVMASLFAAQAHAHEVQPAVGDVTVTQDTVQISFELAIEGMMAGIDLDAVADTNDSPLAGLYDSLRAQDPDDLEAAFRADWSRLSQGFVVRVEGVKLPVEIIDLMVSEVGDVELPRESTLLIQAALPPGDAPVVAGWTAPYGPLVLRQTGTGDEMYSGYLTNGALSDPLPRQGVAQVSALSNFGRYVVLGFEHIVPKGADHILFVLSLFLFSIKIRPLLIQVSAFTLAHTATLALASLQIVSISPQIVEPLIAASIVYAAVENLFGPRIGVRRTALVFLFGLLHGLGFAGVLGEIGLEKGQFVLSLIGFNIGVEIGQLAVIALAIIALFIARQAAMIARLSEDEKPARQEAVLFRATSLTGSLIIAAIGTWWVIERTLL